ncbi:MAG: VOC family protein [Chloroflexi bacterium]|nr:VOC family protein [Chloroflexota bacterium]
MAIQLDMIGIVVHNMEAALRFYRLLGMEIPAGVEAEDHVECITASGYRVAWDTVTLIKSLDPNWVEPVGHGMSLAFKCSRPAEVDQRYQELVEAGYPGRKAPWDAFWGQRYAQIQDPDGNLVDLFAPLS